MKTTIQYLVREIERELKKRGLIVEYKLALKTLLTTLECILDI